MADRGTDKAESTQAHPHQWRWPRGADETGKRVAKNDSSHQTPLYPLCRGAVSVYIPALMGTRQISRQTF